MKRMIVWLLVLAFALAGCQSAASGNTDPNTLGSAPTQTQDTTPTVPSTVKPTEPTVKPTEPTVLPTEPTVLPTEPTVPPVMDPAEIEAYTEYGMQPFAYMVLRYKPEGEFDYPGKAFDRSNMVTGYFYAVDDGDVYLITDQPVVHWDITKKHVYYVTKTEQTKIYRTDLHGQEHTVVYESGSENELITYIQFFGKSEDGKLFFVENKNRVISYDLSTAEKEMLMEAHLITLIAYLPLGQDTGENAGMPAIWWQGKKHEWDEKKGDWYILN